MLHFISSATGPTLAVTQRHGVPVVQVKWDDAFDTMGHVLDFAGGVNEWAIQSMTDPMDKEVDGSLASMLSVGHAGVVNRCQYWLTSPRWLGRPAHRRTGSVPAPVAGGWALGYVRP